MTVFERIQHLAKKQDINLKNLAIKLGFSENLIYRWKTSKPKAEDLAKVADYFNVSVDYLLGREKPSSPSEEDLEKMVDQAMSFGGKPLSEKDRAFAKRMLKIHFEMEDED